MVDSNILCTICARGGSKGVKNKNIRMICGKPLIAYSIEHAKKSGLFNHIVISSDSEDILNISKKYGAEVIFKRPDELATDTAGKIDVIRHAFMEAEKYYNATFNILIDIDSTSPLRSPSDIVKAYEQFVKNGNDILITGSPARRSPYFNLVETDDNGTVVLSKGNKEIIRRQDSPSCYDMNASIYIWKRDAILKERSLFTKKTGLYVMPEHRSYDIDSELDFKIVEYLLREDHDKK